MLLLLSPAPAELVFAHAPHPAGMNALPWKHQGSNKGDQEMHEGAVWLQWLDWSSAPRVAVWGEAEVSPQEYGRGDVASTYFPACESLRVLHSES